ncbi:MAG TPA: HupE/UreJ family protein [Myxococcota bacterium]|nr:HupE/UreJ family protein [Myxococcota bacterium]
MRRLLVVALLCALAPAAALAHRLAPALLELVERGGGRVDVRFKLPLEQPTGSDLRPELPPQCAETSEPVGVQEDTGVIVRWTLDCGPGGLVGSRVALAGLAESGSNALLRIELADGRKLRAVLHEGAPAFEIPARQERIDVARDYARLGVEHILTGFDHLLFVFGLVLLVRGGRPLLWTVTAFTLGHSVTLSLAALGYVHFPSAWIEVLIAGTILLLAAELARPDPDPRDLMRRLPWLVAGGFGLLHGLGFAGALAEVGLPADEIPLALFSFNVGIEVGQLAFVAVVLAARWLLARPLERAPGWLAHAPVTVMGALAAYWCLERGAAALGI